MGDCRGGVFRRQFSGSSFQEAVFRRQNSGSSVQKAEFRKADWVLKLER